MSLRGNTVLGAFIKSSWFHAVDLCDASLLETGGHNIFSLGGSVQDPAVHRWWVLPDYKWGAKKEKVPYGTVS